MPAQPERAPENEVPVQFKYERPVPDGSQVQVQVSTDGNKWEYHQLQKSGNAFAGNVDMPEGTNYKYKFLIISQDGLLAQFDPPKFGATLSGTATSEVQPASNQPHPAPQQPESHAQPHGAAESHAQPHNAPDHPAANSDHEHPSNVVDARSEVIRRKLQGRVKDILGAGRSYEGVENMETLFEQIELELQEIEHEGNIAPIVLGILNKEIAELPNLPAAVRNQFKGKPPPQSYEELEHRFGDGSIVFRRKAFNSLKTNPAARKALGLKPNSPDFPDSGMKKIFERVCNEFDMWETIPYLGMAFERMEEVPPANDPELTKQRRGMLKGILGRLKPREQAGVTKMPSGKKALILDTVVNAGYWTALLAGAPALAASVWLGQGVLGGLTGVHKKDLVEVWREPTARTKGKKIWKVIKENNIFSQWGKSQEGLWSLLKKKTKGFLVSSIPVLGPLLASKEQKEEPTFAPKDAKIKPPEKPVEVEDLMREACKKELGT